MENLILKTRKQLRDESDLGEYGAVAIHRALVERGSKKIPSLRTIGRILLRRGALDGRRRVRRPAPPRGWYLPRVAARQAELDCFDFIEDLRLRGGASVNILTGISLHGGVCGARVQPSWTAKLTAETLMEYWGEHGLPDYVQFDNDTIFCGARQFRDSFGRVIRLCLQLDVIPVFTPPHETGFRPSSRTSTVVGRSESGSAFFMRTIRPFKTVLIVSRAPCTTGRHRALKQLP